jgi:mannitol-specific phosphotransferase system IIBC component
MKSKSQSKSKSKRKIVNKSMSNKSKDKFKSKEKDKNKSKSKSQSKSKSKSRKGSEKEYLQKICRKCGKGELSMSSNKSRGKIYEKKLNQILKFSNYTIPTSPSSAEINEEYFGSYSRNKSNKSPFVTQKRGKKSREK